MGPMSQERGVGKLVAFAVACSTGCVYSPTIQRADNSRSVFEAFGCPGETTIIGNGTPGHKEYRVFNRGGSIASVRAKAE
jgi:hypothetical protein